MKITFTFLSILIAFAVFGFTSFAQADGHNYEVAAGPGMSLNALGSSEGIVLGAWIKKLSGAIDLRVEPNIEIIAPRSGPSLIFAGVSPVLRFSLSRHDLNPFVDAGVGLSFSSRTTVLTRDLGGSFFFSPTAGGGIKFGKDEKGLSLFARWVHHSNAGLFPPNEGIDSLYLLLGYRF